MARRTEGSRAILPERGISPGVFALAFNAMVRRPLLLVFLAALFVSGVGAEPLATIPNPRVKNGTWVTDMAGALKPETIAQLNRMIGEVEKTRGIEMAVVVVRSLDGLTVEDAAEKLFKLWGIGKAGKAGKDNGLLFLWSTGD